MFRTIKEILRNAPTNKGNTDECSEQRKGILVIHENTLMKLFTSSMERLKNKTERLSNENTLLKQEVESLKTGADFQNKWFEEAKRNLEEMRAKNPIEDIKLIIQKHQQLEEKISELEERSTRNKLQFSEFTEKAEGKVLKRGKKVRI